ncbi:MAG: hypothetical protein QOE24_2192 [Frankiales bacterium]|jgi:hypothetical protein|nr:hypothetical protein [Frankiales bacterium]MDX6223601.1 hypothetical protein [Frankiales bacterium]
MPTTDDLKNLDRLDQAVLGAGVLAFILSFFHVFTASASGPGALLVSGLLGKAHATAWHGWGFIGMLLVLAATALAAGRLFAPASLPKLPVGINLLTLALSGLGLLFLVIEWLTNIKSSSAGGIKISSHLGIAGYLLLLVVLAQAAAAYLLFKKSGEVVPDFKAMQANRATGAGTPPPPVYGGSPTTPATYPPATTPAGDYTLDDSTPPPPPV